MSEEEKETYIEIVTALNEIGIISKSELAYVSEFIEEVSAVINAALEKCPETDSDSTFKTKNKAPSGER